MRFVLFIFFFSTTVISKPIIVKESITSLSLMPFIQYYIDYGKKHSIHTIKGIDEKFEDNDRTILSVGFDRDIAIWAKVELQNGDNRNHKYFLEFYPGLTQEKYIYDCSLECKKLQPIEENYFVDPIFEVDLEANKLHTFYVRGASDGTAVKVRLTLKNKKEAYSHSRELYKVYYLFIGGMIVLFLYNLFIYFFSKEISYIYYCLYIVSITLHQVLFAGLAVKILGEKFMTFFHDTSVLFPVSFVFFMTLFTSQFFNFKKYYPKLYNMMKLYILLLIFMSVICLIDNSWLNITMNIGAIGFLGILVIGYYLLFKGNILARFFVAGWTLMVVSVYMMNLQNYGYFDLFVKFPYIVEFGVMLEAVLFSLALAYKLKVYREQKEQADELLLEQQRSETERLENVVEERTKSLVDALDERELLMKELNHRVKNNMQLIVSLLRLQANSQEDKKLIDSLQVAEHRIQAMSHLHELFYAQESLTHVDMKEYISNMSKELSKNFDPQKLIDISLHVKGKLPLKQAVYIGLILNEILTNAFKYAFKDIGEIEISFTCKENKAVLHVKDNGRGFNQEEINPNSLGMSVIQTLVIKQLEGTYTLETDDGTSWKVEFEL